MENVRMVTESVEIVMENAFLNSVIGECQVVMESCEIITENFLNRSPIT
jgi:hypothetical protein